MFDFGDSDMDSSISSAGEEHLFVGLDIGGTNLKAGIVKGDSGEVLCSQTEALPSSPSSRKPDALVSMLVALGNSVLAEEGLSWMDVTAVGVACPGQIKRRRWDSDQGARVYEAGQGRLCGTLKAHPAHPTIHRLPTHPLSKLVREIGVVVGTSTFPGWSNVPLAAHVQEATGRPTTVLNDASAAASAEYAGMSGEDTIVVLTLGTGVGMGVVQGGQVICGTSGLIEGGHMIVNPSPKARLCACGQRGCLEAYASATAVVSIATERYHDLDKSGGGGVHHHGVSVESQASMSWAGGRATPQRTPSKSLKDRIRVFDRHSGVEGKREVVQALGNSREGWEQGIEDDVQPKEEDAVPAVLNSKAVFSMAAKGDPVAKAVVSEACQYLGLACLNICRLLDPAAILFTGGMSKAEGIVDMVRETFFTRGWTVLPHKCHIGLTTSADADYAGVVGAAGAAACEYAIVLAEEEFDRFDSQGRSVTAGADSHAGSTLKSFDSGIFGVGGLNRRVSEGKEGAGARVRRGRVEGGNAHGGEDESAIEDSFQEDRRSFPRRDSKVGAGQESRSSNGKNGRGLHPERSKRRRGCLGVGKAFLAVGVGVVIGGVGVEYLMSQRGQQR